MDAQSADTTVIVVLTSTSIVTPSTPDPAVPTPTPDPAQPAQPTPPVIPGQNTVTTILVTSEKTVEVTQTPTPSIPSGSSFLVPASSSATGSNGINAHTNTSASTGLTTAAKIAIGVAVPCGAILILAFIGLLFWRRHQHAKNIREKRLAEIRDYSYNPNLNDSDGNGGGAYTNNGQNRHLGSKERPDSLTTLHGTPVIGNGKSSSDDNSTTMGNYRGWGPAPEVAATTTAAPVSTLPAPSGPMNANMMDSGLVVTTPPASAAAPPMGLSYTSNPHRPTYPYDSSPRSPDQTLGPSSPAQPVPYYEPNNNNNNNNNSNIDGRYIPDTTSPLQASPAPPPPIITAFQHQPATAITSDHVISPIMGYAEMPTGSETSALAATTPYSPAPQQAPPNSNLAMLSNNTPQRIYQTQLSNPKPYQTHQPQYSSLFSPAPEESRRVASNF